MMSGVARKIRGVLGIKKGRSGERPRGVLLVSRGGCLL